MKPNKISSSAHKFAQLSLSFILLAMIGVPSYAQENDSLEEAIVEYYKNDPLYERNYYDETYFSNGYLKKKGYLVEIKNNERYNWTLPVGEIVHYRRNGVKKCVALHDLDGVLMDTTKYFNRKGELSDETLWDDGPAFWNERRSWWKKGHTNYYYHKEKQLYWTTTYKLVGSKLVRHGEWKDYDSKGNLVKLRVYENGKKISKEKYKPSKEGTTQQKSVSE